MPTKKKTTKKYDLTRSAIADRIFEIVSELENIDTYETSPTEVNEAISDVCADLESLREQVTDEAF